MPGATAYRRLLLLYPRALREHYGEEMALVYADLRRRHGRRIWARLLLDLAVSVPRTRLESAMSTPLSRRAATALIVAVGVSLSLLGLTVFGPEALPVPVLLAALALAQRSRLARSLSTGPGSGGVRSAAAGLTASLAVLAGAAASWLYQVATYESLSTATVLLHNVVGFAGLTGTIAYTVLLAVRLHSRRLGATG